jgi:4-aminobutyrate aminotransferase-like enzyme
LGKALTGGFPLSACVGRAKLMDDAWPPSTGEAIHTSTFLGHPVGCAMALAHMKEIEALKLVQRSERLGKFLLQTIQSRLAGSHAQRESRGLGLCVGIELRLSNGCPATALAIDTIKEMLGKGFILLPEGAHSNVISFTPPLTISENQLEMTVRALEQILAKIADLIEAAKLSSK